MQIDVQRDGPRIGTDGFERWVDIFADILSVDEREFVLVAERMEGLQAGLRAFYTVWACKEAFVKMTGDALMAGWLRELAFPGLRVPSTIATGNSDGVSRLWGDRVMTEVVLQGKVVEGVRIELVSLGNDYIVATAIDRGVALPEFELVRVSPDGGTLDCYLDMENMSRLLSYDMKD